jgi:hypothetical protein
MFASNRTCPNSGDYPALDLREKPSYQLAPTGWRKKAPGWGLAGLLVLVAIGLVGKAEAAVIEPHHFASIPQPIKSLSELSEPLRSKNVLVMKDAPYIQGLPFPVANICNLFIGDIICNDGGHKPIFLRSDACLAKWCVLWLCENEARNFCIGQNLSLDAVTNVICGSSSVVQNEGFCFKSKFVHPVLIDSLSYNDRQIGTQLSTGSFGLILAQYNETPRDYGEQNGSKGSNGGGKPIKGFSDLQERDKGYVVCGAFFIAGFVGIAIWLMTRREPA